ncbi:HNH endonuclease [Pseudomonas sp. MF6772]|uniref:HNH endonuclease n=1 Tax=Pseudomonas sp. MF6772 TaxID=2797533 RepID=UPI0018E7F748|nr:HNH endonuclease [Pseudomonas sp. MF6772]MBJ2270469.1 HNH endonuclease [Pseudomonas sp. MF6772]
MDQNTLTADRVRELLNYCPETGIFTRKIRTAQRHKASSRADFLVTSGSSPGYHRVSVDSKRYQAHRVAWLYVHGVWPAEQIDHINGVRSDNRIANLRVADYTLNMENQRSAYRNNRSGLLGAIWDQQSSKWRGQIVVEKKKIHLGSFSTAQDAHAAYLEAKRTLHKGCTI